MFINQQQAALSGSPISRPIYGGAAQRPTARQGSNSIQTAGGQADALENWDPNTGMPSDIYNMNMGGMTNLWWGNPMLPKDQWYGSFSNPATGQKWGQGGDPFRLHNVVR